MAHLLTKEQLARYLQVGCRQIDLWITRQEIPVITLGPRTQRFVCQDVQDALNRLYIKEEAADGRRRVKRVVATRPPATQNGEAQ